MYDSKGHALGPATDRLEMHCGTELRACCRPTDTGAGPSDARIAASAPHSTGVFLACAWCLELSRNLENPHWIRRRRDCLLCAPQARPARAQARAHCLLVCPAPSCSAITATAMQPSSAAHCGIGRTETRVQARRLRTPVYTACPIVVIGLHLTALPPPDSSAAAAVLLHSVVPSRIQNVKHNLVCTSHKFFCDIL